MRLNAPAQQNRKAKGNLLVQGTLALACSCQEKREFSASSRNGLFLQLLHDLIVLEKYHFLGYAHLETLEKILHPKECALSSNCFNYMQTLQNEYMLSRNAKSSELPGLLLGWGCRFTSPLGYAHLPCTLQTKTTNFQTTPNSQNMPFCSGPAEGLNDGRKHDFFLNHQIHFGDTAHLWNHASLTDTYFTVSRGKKWWCDQLS